jgi:hypothetical protein
MQGKSEVTSTIAGATHSGNTDSPFGIVIGDSIALGYYDSRLQPLESRLQPVYDPSFINPPGTFAYELEKLTRFTWYNQAIGGQTTGELCRRWCRDALAQDSDPGDGRGGSTLDAKPTYIVLDTGTSELRAANPESVPVIKKNIFRMVTTATENDISVIVINIAPIKTANISDILEVNSWLSKTLPQFGDRVRICDAYTKLSVIGYRDFQIDRNNRRHTNIRNFLVGTLYPCAKALNLVAEAKTIPMLDKKYNWGDGCHWSALAVKDVAAEIVARNQDLLILSQESL